MLAVTCDGASPNCKLFRMHFPMTKEDDMNPDTNVTYRTVSLFSSEKCFIYFISGVSHSMKTARNCLYNSFKGRYTRYMWKMVCSYFGITFLIFFMKIENVVYTSCQNYQMKYQVDALLKNECTTCSPSS